MKKRTAFAALLMAFLMMFSSIVFAEETAEEEYRLYTLETENYRGFVLDARLYEVEKNQFKLSVTMHMPPTYTVNDGAIAYRLFINGSAEVVAEHVTIIFTETEGVYEVYYGTTHYEGEIESLRIYPQWDKMRGELIEEDAMDFPI